MKAAVLKAFGDPLSIETVPDPTLGTGEVVVDVVAAPVLSYTNEVLSGARKYLLDLPQIPGIGAIGRVRAFGPDATQLNVGDWVFCDPTVRSRDGGADPEITLQGWSARGEGGLRLQKYFRGGGFAEQIRVPTENAIRIGQIDATEAAGWCAVSSCLVPYGGLLAADLRPGETVLISGATGHYGSAAVAVAVAMGAACVVAPGRNEAVLQNLQKRFGDRVQAIKLSGDSQQDTQRMKQAAPRPIDCVLDILPPAASTEAVRSAIMTVRRHGRVVLMGGVGMLGGNDLALPYPWIMRNGTTIYGQWMYPPHAVISLSRLVHAGLLRIEYFETTAFSLERANEAVEHAAEHGGPFKMTVIQPAAH